MKKLTIIIIAIIFFAINAFSQDNKKMELRKFDIKEYNENMDENHNYIQKIKNGVIIEKYCACLSITEDIYCERIKYPNKYQIIYYYYDNGSLKQEAHYYSHCEIKTIQYDIYGNIIKDTDYEKLYPYKIEQLREKIHKELKINDNIKYSVRRYYDELLNKKVYDLEVPEKEGLRSTYDYLIDGENGEILLIIFFEFDPTIHKIFKLGELYNNPQTDLSESNYTIKYVKPHDNFDLGNNPKPTIKEMKRKSRKGFFERLFSDKDTEDNPKKYRRL